MNWKQPIPTNLENIFKNDWGCNLLYQQLIYRSANSDGFFTDKNGVTTEIKRGQTVFGRGQYAVYLCQSPSTIRNWLSKLLKIYKIVDTQEGLNFTIVTIKNYDEITNMDNLRTTKGQPKDTSKSVKSVKSEKEEGNLFKNPKEIPLQELVKIALTKRVMVSDVKTVVEEMDFKISEGTQNPYKDYIRAVSNWVDKKISWKQVEPLDDISLQIMKSEYDPEIQKRVELTLRNMGEIK